MMWRLGILLAIGQEGTEVSGTIIHVGLDLNVDKESFHQMEMKMVSGVVEIDGMYTQMSSMYGIGWIVYQACRETQDENK